MTFFSNWVRIKRIEQGLTQEALAKKTGLSRTYVSLIENGRAPGLTLETVLTITRAFRESLLIGTPDEVSILTL